MTSFVLVPGAWLDGHAFDVVGEYLADISHSINAVTLPGLVEAVDHRVTLESWIDHVVHQVRHLDRRDPIVLAGHSFAGLVVGPAAARLGAGIGFWSPDLAQEETGLDDDDQTTLLAHAHPMPARRCTTSYRSPPCRSRWTRPLPPPDQQRAIAQGPAGRR